MRWPSSTGWRAGRTSPLTRHLGPDHRAGRPGVLGVARRPPPPRAAPADPRHAPVLAGRAAGRRSSGGPGPSTGSTPRPNISSRRESRGERSPATTCSRTSRSAAPRRRERLARASAGRPGPVGLSFQYRAAARGFPRLPGRSPTSPTPPTTSSSSRARSRAGRRPGRPWPAAADCPICSRWRTSSRGRTSSG